MVGNEADIRADLEIDGSIAVNQLRRVSAEIRRTLREAQGLERTLNQAFGQRTTVTGPRSKALDTGARVARRGSDATAVTNALVQGRAATIRAATPVLTETIRKQNETLEKAIRAPQERFRAAATESQNQFNRLLGVGDSRLQGTQRTTRERQLNSLFNARDKQIAQRQTTLTEHASQAQRSFNSLLGVGDSRLQGTQRTQHENRLGALFKQRDRQLRQSAQSLQQRAAQAQTYYNEILGVGDSRLRGTQRTAYERRFAANLNRRDQEQGRAPSQRLSGEQINARAEQTRSIRDATLFGDGGRSLFRIQARLLAHYVVLNQIFSAYQFGVRFVLDFDRALQNLQAITVTSNTNMMALSISLRQVSRETKFTAVEVAEAATILGQAGFSTAEIQGSIRSITLLAAATGSTLKQAVDVATSTLGVFNLQASEMASVANQITTAINRSKLNIDKLALGLQFAGNVAADAGLGLDELLASLSQFANAGVRSGSTLGTGIRQLIIDLAAPSRKLAARYQSLGLTVDETSIKTQGFIGVLRNLQEAGFSGSDGLEFLEVRAANAFSAITKGLPEIEEFRRGLLLADSAARANATQMLSLANRWARFVSVIGEVVLLGSGPITGFFKSIVSGATTMGVAVADSGKAFTFLTSALIGVGISALTAWLARVSGITRVMASATAATVGWATATNVLSAALARVTLLFRTPGGLIGLAAFAGIALLTRGFGLFAEESKNVATAQDEAQAQFENTKGRVESLEQSISSINDTISRLSDRERRLDANQGELQTELIRTRDRFADLGLTIGSNITLTSELLKSLVDLRSELQRGLPGAIEAQITSLQSTQAARQASVRERVAAAVPQDIEAFLTDELGVKSRGQGFVARLRARNRRPPTKDTELDRLLSNLRAGGSDLSFGEGVESSEGLRQLADVVLRLRFRPNAQGSLPDNELTRANALILRLQRDAPTAAAGDPQRALLGRFQRVIGQGISTNREAELSDNQRSLLDIQRADAHFQNENDPVISPAVSRFRRNTTSRVAAAQGFLGDPQRTEEELVRALEQIESDAASTRALIPNQLRDPGGPISDEDADRYRRRYELPIDNIVKAANRALQAHRERSREGNRARNTAQGKVVNRRATNLIGQINSAGTLAEVEELVRSGLAGVPTDLIEQSGLNRILGRFRTQDDRGSLRGPGALSQRISVREDRLNTVETPGKATKIQADLRTAAGLENVEQLRTFAQTVERRLTRINSQQRGLNNAQRQLQKGRGINPTQEASDLRTQAQFDLSNAQEPLTQFDIRNQGASGLRGRPRLEARRELETTVLQENISIYQNWVKAHQEVVEGLELERLGREKNTEAAQKTLDEAELEGASLKARTDATKDLTAAEKAEAQSTTQLAAAKRQLSDVNKNLNQDEARLAAQPGVQSAPERFLEALNNTRTNLGLNRSWTQELILGVEDFTRSFTEGFATVIKGFLDGTNTLKDVFRGFIDSVLDLAINRLAKQLTNIIFNAIAEGFGGSGGSSGLGLLGSILGPVLGGFTGGAGGVSFGSGAGAASGNINFGSTGAASGIYATGGRVQGGIPGRDSVRSLLTPDEFVLKASSARSIGYDTLDNLNQRGARALSGVNSEQVTSIVTQQNGPSELNVWVVQPQQLPNPSPSDIIAHVVNDGNRNGPVKKLIKNVQLGMV